MKKHLALVLALVMVLGSFSFVSAAPDFSDVKGTSFEDAVTRLESLNVLKGYPDGTFKPADTITRAEFAAVAVRVSGLEQAAMAAKGLPTGFSDVPAWHWAAGYVGTAAKLGIVNGVGNGMFAPETPVKYEEAVTMLVRALGYEPAAQAKGGYPFGYLIVANETDLLAGALGTQGTWATRGFVAQITDNALEIEMMVQVGYGTDIRYEVSNKDNGGVKYLFDKMGFDTFEGRVTSFNDSKNKITIKGDDNETLDVAEGFDFYEVNGVTIKIWAKDDKVVAYTLKDDVKFDAVEVDDDELTLITEDENYEVAKGATLKIDGDSAKLVDFTAGKVDYAKVVFDEDNDIIWLEGYTLTGFIVVEKTDDELLLDYEDGELDVEDFTIVKDGMTLSVEEIEEGDVVLYNTSEEFAVVYNNSKEGVIDRAYANSFRMDGKTYDLNVDLGAVYLEDGEMGDVTKTVLEEYVDEADKVMIFVDFYGDVIVIEGSKGTAKTSTYGMALEENAIKFTDPRSQKDYLRLDGVNELGASVSFDASRTVTTDSGINIDTTTIAALQVIEYTVDEDGDLEEIDILNTSGKKTASNDSFKITDRYAANYRLQSDTVFFILNDDNDEVDKVFTLANADKNFKEVTEFEAFSVKGVYADYIVVYASDAGATDEEVGVITRVRKLANDKEFELSINIEGKTSVFVVDKKDISGGLKTQLETVDYAKEKGKIVSFLINSDKDEIKDVKYFDNSATYEDLIGATTSGAFKVKVLRDRTFTLDANTALTFELDNAVVLDATGTTKTINFSAINDGDTVNVYYEGDVDKGTVFVKYLVVTVAVDNEDETPSGDTYTLTAKAEVDGNKTVTLGTKTYVFIGSNTDYNIEVGKTVKVTFSELRGETVVLTMQDVTPTP